jgi:hypothetical protein
MKKFEGTLAGVEGSAGEWSFEGVKYDTPATADDLEICAEEAMAQPDEKTLANAQLLVFGPGTTYTSQALLAMVAVYEREVGMDGSGSEQVMSILQQAARRIACIEALTI